MSQTYRLVCELPPELTHQPPIASQSGMPERQMLGRSGIVLLIGFVRADGLCKRHVQTVAVALFAALDGAHGRERNNNSWRFVFHVHRLLSLHKRGFGTTVHWRADCQVTTRHTGGSCSALERPLTARTVKPTL